MMKINKSCFVLIEFLWGQNDALQDSSNYKDNEEDNEILKTLQTEKKREYPGPRNTPLFSTFRGTNVAGNQGSCCR